VTWRSSPLLQRHQAVRRGGRSRCDIHALERQSLTQRSSRYLVERFP
jgi:hypothetical protein